jgi:antitoxin (DNA-binding transcriptional repressor) of toxin-antitoxin stability system
VIADVVAGQVVTVTSHGRPVAQIAPLAKDTVRGLIDTGQARAAKHPLSELAPTPASRPGTRPLSDVLDELRDDDRY